MAALRVLYVEAGSGSGGSSASLARLIRKLSPRGIEPRVLVNQRGSFIRQLEASGVHVEECRVRGSSSSGPVRDWRGQPSRLWRNLAAVHLPLFWEVRRQIRRHRPDVVHLNNSPRVALAAIAAARCCRVPVVCHLRVARPLDRLELWLMRWIDRLIVISQTAHRLCAQQGVPEEQLVCIPDGLDIATFRNGFTRAAARTPLGLAEEHVVLGVVSRLQPGKGLEPFVRAMQRVAATHPSARAVIVGDACEGDLDYRAQLEHLIARLDLARHVTLVGWVGNPASVYPAFDVVVQTSLLPEGFSLVCLEAMACGLPVVSTNVGAVPELVEQGVTGRLVPPKDPRALAKAIAELLEQPQQRHQMGQAGYRRAIERFDIARTAEAVERVYHDVAWSR